MYCICSWSWVLQNVSDARRNFKHTWDNTGELVYKPVSHRWVYQFILGLQSTHIQTNMKVINIYLSVSKENIIKNSF